MTKREFFLEVIEQVLEWTNDWDRYNDSDKNPKPMSTDEFSDFLIDLEASSNVCDH